MLTVGNVQEDVSKAQVWFYQPQTNNPIVIYGVKKLNLREVTYNGIKEYPVLTVRLFSGETVAHAVGFHLTEKGGVIQLTRFHFSL